MAGDVGAFFTRQYLQLGPVFRVHALHRRFTVLAGPEADLFVMRQGKTYLRSREFWAVIRHRVDPATDEGDGSGRVHFGRRPGQAEVCEACGMLRDDVVSRPVS